MALGFSAMTRVFEGDSSDTIKERLENILFKIASLNNEQDFQKEHDSFCEWFMNNVKTAERKKDGLVIKQSALTSYGQGAKVLDVVLKVLIYYCHHPDLRTAERTTKWLNAAIDTRMLKYLKNMPDQEASLIHATTIEGVDKETYSILQMLVRRDISRSFSGHILPVQWDDIMWRKLNKA